MKRTIALLLLVLCLLLAGCRKAEAPTETTGQTEPATEAQIFFADQVQILGVDVGDMDPEQAKVAIDQRLEEYVMTLTVNGNTVKLTAADIEMTVPLEAIQRYAEGLESGGYAPVPEPEYSSILLGRCISGGVDNSVLDAAIQYSSTAGCFVVRKERSGVSVDMTQVKAQLEPALKALEESCSVTADQRHTEPTVLSTDPMIQQGLAKANEYIAISLSYRFAPEKIDPKVHTIHKNEIGGMIRFDAGFSPYVDSAAVDKYAFALAEKYNVRGQFQTSGGFSLNVNAGSLLQAVDAQALANDLRHCLTNKISETREAPYGPRVEAGTQQGESYVEIDLTHQHLWVYRNGVQVVSTPIVSGCVNTDCETPTGVYYIYNKSTNVTLTGPTWSSPVKYWMPFSGGYGLHDANWRSSFGSDIYLYDGSHGCVNIPPAIAGQVYENVEVGTKVILYGGATDLKHKPQVWNGTTAYSVEPGCAPFLLDITGSTTGLTYASDNAAVAQVSGAGMVTVVGAGTARITVTAPAGNGFDGGTTTVTITAAYDCSKGHTLTWQTTREAGCVAGEKVGTCKCGHQEKQTIEPTKDHSFTKWNTVTAPGCETPGQKTATCNGCTKTKTEEIPAIGHNFSGGVCANGCGRLDPNQPTQPSEPSEPTQPSDPGDSTQPTNPDPSDPSDNTQPTNPDPSDPGDTTQPTNPDPGQPSDP